MTFNRVFDKAVAGQFRKIAVTAALLGLTTGIGRTQSAEDLRITVGKSIVIDYPGDIRQISTSNPEVVDASPVTTRARAWAPPPWWSGAKPISACFTT